MTARARPLTAPAVPTVLGYVRVSKEDQARDEKASLAQQRAAITAMAGRLGLTITDDAVFADPGRSGGTAEERPGFMSLVRYCEEHPRLADRLGYVLVLNDSRWGRFEDPEEATYWRVLLRRSGWIVRFAEGDDVEDPLGRGVLRTIHSAQASAYRQAVKANARRGAMGTAAKGFWQNEAPLGYRRVTVGGGRPGTVLAVGQRKADDEQVRLTPGPDSERDVIRYMYRRYDSGEVSLGSLTRELRARWPGLRKWGRQVVRVMLRNPAYCGDVVWMRRPHNRTYRVRPLAEWVVTRDAHPALVSREMWNRVQARLARNRKETRPTANGYPLRNLLTCTDCGSPYMGAGGPRGPASDPDRYRFYREKEHDGRRCGHRQGTLQKRVIEPLVINEVAKIVARPEVQRLIAREFDRLLEGDDETVARRGIEKERQELEAQHKRVVERIARGLITDAEAATVLAEIRAGIERLTTQRETLRFDQARRRALAAEKERLLAMAADFAARAERLSGTMLRELVTPWLAGAEVDKRRRTVTLTLRRVPLIDLTSTPAPD